MLEIIDVHKSFGEQKVLQGLTLSIAEGQISSIIGGNGSGKTTLFNLITGFINPDKGEIRYNGQRIDNLSSASINSKGITRTFQDLRIINQLTVRENILLSFKNNPGEMIFNSFLPSFFLSKRYNQLSIKANSIIDQINLKKVENNLAGEISFGQQKLLTIGCCLANDAMLLLLDEPVAGIDNENYIRIQDLILKLQSEGKTILQIEHNQKFVEHLSDNIWFLNDGKTLFFDNFQEFISNPTVNAHYLN